MAELEYADSGQVKTWLASPRIASQTITDLPYTAMSRRPPSHEIRGRWMTAISASFHPFTVFRFTRKRALQASDLIDELEEELINLEVRLSMYLPAESLLTFWKEVCNILKVLDEGYLDILHRLATFEWTWWQNTDRTQRPLLRARKESLIKSLAVYDWILSLLRNAFESSFQKSRPWFLNSRAEHRKIGVLRRRFSYHDHGDYTAAEIHERAVIEMSMIRWTRCLEEQLLTSITDLQGQYNKGKVFEHFVRHVQWTNEEEQKDWELDDIEWPYPDCSLKLEGLDIPGSKSLERHAPIDGVPAWQEDESYGPYLRS